MAKRLTLLKSLANTIISIGKANVMADVTPSTVLIFILVVLDKDTDSFQGLLCMQSRGLKPHFIALK
jgi:hypothetical protein